MRSRYKVSTRRLFQGPLAAILLGVLYFALFLPEDSPRAVDEYDRDEGFNLMKALLVNRGFSLYGDIWSDQPPGFTYLLAGFTRVFGETPETARLLTVLLAAATVAGVYEICRRGGGLYRGHVAGLCAALALIQSRIFVHYSAAVMITLPSISFVVLAWLALSARSLSRTRVVGAGALFGLGLGVKLMVLPILPAFVFLLDGRALVTLKPPIQLLGRRGLLFASGCALTLAIVFAPSLGQAGLSALYEAHASGTAVMKYSSVWNFFREDPRLFVLAAVGAVLGIRRNGSARFAAAWIGLGTFALSRHAPVWHHHRFLVSVPACVLVGIGVDELVRLSMSASRLSLRWSARVASLGVLGVFAWWSSHGGLSQLASVVSHHSRSSTLSRALRAAQKHAPHARLAVTTNQMIAYRLGLPVPPNLAVTSSKRRNTGGLPHDEVRSTIRETKPDVVILTNRWGKVLTKNIVSKDLGSAYRRVYYKKSARELAVYVRKTDRPRGVD